MSVETKVRAGGLPRRSPGLACQGCVSSLTRFSTITHSLLPNSCRKDKNKGHRTVLSLLRIYGSHRLISHSEFLSLLAFYQSQSD